MRKRGEKKSRARQSTRVRSANKTPGRGRLRISFVVTARCRWRNNNERYRTIGTCIFSLAGWLSPTIKELLEGTVHNLHDAYVFKIGCAFDRFDVSPLHMVG